jgi:hypothetical protein
MATESRQASQPLQGCDASIADADNPGLPKRNPGLELANAFSVSESGLENRREMSVRKRMIAAMTYRRIEYNL